MRLIDADRFEAFCYDVPMDVDADSFMRGIEFVLDKIDVAKTIDAVPVIRCRDCKYSCAMITSRSKDGQEKWIRFCDKHKNWYPKDDWFCADGERKEE